MERGSIILLVDLALDFLAVFGFLYLLSHGYFTNLEKGSLDAIFLKTGVVGLTLALITVYLLLKKG